MSESPVTADTADRVAFEDFVTARLPALVRFGRVLTGNTPAAEDLVQTALAKSYAKWGRIEASDPEGYVRRVMANTHASWWRRPLREHAYEQLPERTGGGPDPYVSLELRDAIWRALGDLSSRQRAALVLRFYEDLSIEEIADALGCRIGTAKSLVSRGLAALRETSGLREGEETTLGPGDEPGGNG